MELVTSRLPTNTTYPVITGNITGLGVVRTFNRETGSEKNGQMVFKLRFRKIHLLFQECQLERTQLHM